MKIIAATLPLSMLLMSLGCSSDDAAGGGGCESDADCKGARLCVEQQCVEPGVGGTGGAPGQGSAGKSTSSGGSGGSAVTAGAANGAACTLSSNDCDPDCQASCGTPSCVELCCKTVESPGVICGGSCRPKSVKDCGDGCVDTANDMNNCGACGNVCKKPMYYSCENGKCELPDY